MSDVNSNQKEEFGNVLGALGAYDKIMASAVNQMNQSDPSKRLQPNNDWSGGLYLQSTLTKMQQQGIPPREPVTILSKCKEQCKSRDPLSSQKCEGTCFCRNNCARACSIDCQYTDEPQIDCMRGCMATKITNCNQFSWSFYNH